MKDVDNFVAVAIREGGGGSVTLDELSALLPSMPLVVTLFEIPAPGSSPWATPDRHRPKIPLESHEGATSDPRYSSWSDESGGDPPTDRARSSLNPLADEDAPTGDSRFSGGASSPPDLAPISPDSHSNPLNDAESDEWGPLGGSETANPSLPNSLPESSHQS